MVTPIRHPFTAQDNTAIKMGRMPKSALPPVMAGRKQKYAISTSEAFPSMISGMIPGTAVITGEEAMRNAVTGVITARISPHISPDVITANTMHRLMIGPVI